MAMGNEDAYKVGVEEQKTAPTLKELGHRAHSHVNMSVQGKGLCCLSRGLTIGFYIGFHGTFSASNPGFVQVV